MGRIVIGVYAPKAGQYEALLELVKQHVPLLRKLDLATIRPATVMRSAQDQVILEMFEWKSPEAMEAAHQHPDVLAMWDQFAALSDYRPLASLLETHDLFAEFEPLAIT
jgi:quinol monooxygenase YgiN